MDPLCRTEHYSSGDRLLKGEAEDRVHSTHALKNQPIYPLKDVVVTTGTVHELIREDASYWKKMRSGLAIWREDAYAGVKRERYGAQRSMLCNFYCACVFRALLCTDNLSSISTRVG